MERRPPLWVDRKQAGVELAARLRDDLPRDGRALVLGLPRGGVVVAAEVARLLDIELDALVVCKVGVPWHPELALGAVGGDGVRVRNDDVVRHTGLSDAQLEQAFIAAESQVATREKVLRGGRALPEVTGRPAVIVDDGLATGATALAATQVVRALSASVVVLAVPVAPADIDSRLAAAVDAFVALARPRRFGAVGTWYEDFRQVEDDDVRALLDT
ncbi:MAG: phosphoribosyltransferase [Jiangellaceae bacterium]